ncbi:MAG: hypothetical protein KF862_27485 [Chitinophagaceae bacterium]|nr:hypothetical protein [Chitinophagaceae bacterium]
MPFERKMYSNPEPTSPLYCNGEKADVSSLDFYRRNLKGKGISEKEFLDIQLMIEEEERTKIGRELHDGVNSLLAVVKLYIDCIEVDTVKGMAAREQALSILTSAIDNIRIISAELVVSQKKDVSLLQLITDLVAKIKALGIFKISFKHSRNNDLTKICAQRRLMLFRIFQEQLNNIIKHSKAKHVDIRLICRSKKAVLMISDDGVGFDTSRAAAGTGMSNIYARIVKFNGAMEIKSAVGNGCALKVSLPLSG